MTYKNGTLAGCNPKLYQLKVEDLVKLPKDDKIRKQVDLVVTKLNALVKGFIARLKFKKIYFLYLVTGKKPHMFKAADFNSIPKSDIPIVNYKEKVFGRL